jgi:hypothetical protein
MNPSGNNVPMLAKFFAQCILHQSLSQLLPHYSPSIKAQFENIGKISGTKKMLSGCADVPFLTTEELNEIVNMILSTQITCRPLLGPEMREIIEKKIPEDCDSGRPLPDPQERWTRPPTA